MDKHIIRTSDRKLFKECKTKWDFGSKIRMDYEPIRTPKNLEFGTAIHVGLESYYDPRAQNWEVDTRTANAIAAFSAENESQRDNALSVMDTPEVNDDYDERRTLGADMLQYYCLEWAPQNDKFTVVAVELEFEVPVLVPEEAVVAWDTDDHGDIGRNGFSVIRVDDVLQLFYQGLPVVYQGRIDLIVEDEDNFLWIVDHKTARAFKEETFHLDVDTQVTSYAWAAQFFLDKPVRGVIYNQIKKSVPGPPKVNKNGSLSRDKSQATTYDLYVRAIEEHGLNELDYSDFLDYLWQSETEYIRRFDIERSQSELDSQGRMIYAESLDMLGSPSIYPNPSEFNCGGCAFQGPCLARIDGSDPDWILADTSVYRLRSLETTSG